MKPKVNIISLGCSKNLVDSEKIINNVAQMGGIVCKDRNGADIIIINTCGFINPAKEESINAILETARLKEEGSCKNLIVTGCLVQRYKKELQKEIPEIDHLVGVDKFDEVCAYVFCKTNGYQAKQIMRLMDEEHSMDKRQGTGCKKERYGQEGYISLTPRHYAYLKISEGCNNCCTYCTIPAIRGRYRSRPIEDIVEEARLLGANGVKELNIIAQDTTYYGLDLYKKQMLHLLLQKISEIGKIKWIRLFYTHPGRFYDELIKVITDNSRICNYIDLPIQHINDEILKRMARHTTRLQIERLIDKLRHLIPDLVLRTSIIVGFPGETDTQFNELIDFINSTRFERLGAFIYSREEDTPASSFKNHISKRVKMERYATLMSVQQKITFKNNKKMVGKRLKVLIDSQGNSPQKIDMMEEIKSTSGSDIYAQADKSVFGSKLPTPQSPILISSAPAQVWLGRYYGDGPDVDSNVIVISRSKLQTGTFKDVLIHGVSGYNLIGSC